MTKDVSSIKEKVNQLIATQHNQQKTLVHVIPIVNVTRYATQVDRQTHQHSNEHSRKETPGHHNTLQHQTLTVEQPELQADCT